MKKGGMVEQHNGRPVYCIIVTSSGNHGKQLMLIFDLLPIFSISRDFDWNPIFCGSGAHLRACILRMKSKLPSFIKVISVIMAAD